MLLIVSIKIMMLHTDRLLPTWRLFKLLPLTGGGEICHRKNYLGGTTTLGCEHDTFGARGITQLRMMSAAGVYRRKVSRAGFSGRPDGMAL
jgi:hypothetical protein